MAFALPALVITAKRRSAGIMSCNTSRRLPDSPGTVIDNPEANRFLDQVGSFASPGWDLAPGPPRRAHDRDCIRQNRTQDTGKLLLETG